MAQISITYAGRIDEKLLNDAGNLPSLINQMITSTGVADATIPDNQAKYGTDVTRQFPLYFLDISKDSELALNLNDGADDPIFAQLTSSMTDLGTTNAYFYHAGRNRLYWVERQEDQTVDLVGMSNLGAELWSNYNAYQEDQIVFHDNKFWICTQSFRHDEVTPLNIYDTLQYSDDTGQLITVTQVDSILLGREPGNPHSTTERDAINAMFAGATVGGVAPSRTPSITFDSDLNYWQQIQTGDTLSFIENNTYNAGGLVYYREKLYVCKTTTNSNPDQSPSSWSEYTINLTDIQGVQRWEPNTTYDINTVVMGSDGFTYVSTGTVPAADRLTVSDPIVDAGPTSPTASNQYWTKVTDQLVNYNPPTINTDYVPGANYKRRDVVSYKGKLYVNVTGTHDDTRFPDTDIDNWKEYVSSLSFIPNFDPTPQAPYQAGDVVYHNNQFFTSLIDNPGNIPDSDSDGDGIWGDWLPTDPGLPNLINDISNYYPGAGYKIGDVIMWDSRFWVNISGSDDPNLSPAADTANWKEYTEYTGATVRRLLWDSDTNYTQDDIVIGSDGLTYLANAGSGPTNAAGSQDPVLDTNRTYWRPASKGETGVGDVLEQYDSGALYNPGDVIAYDGHLYVNLVGDTNPELTPDVDLDNWREYFLPAAWQSTTIYQMGDQVADSDGNVYVYVNTTPDDSEDPRTDFDNSHWVEVQHPDVYKIPEWRTGQPYAANDLVAQNGRIYKNISGNWTNVQPSQDPANWVLLNSNFVERIAITQTAAGPVNLTFSLDFSAYRSFSLWINGVMIDRNNWRIVDAANGVVELTDGAVYTGDIVYLEGSFEEAVFHTGNSSAAATLPSLFDVDFGNVNPIDGNTIIFNTQKNSNNPGGAWELGNSTVMYLESTTNDFQINLQNLEYSNNSLIFVKDTRALWYYSGLEDPNVILLNDSTYVGRFTDITQANAIAPPTKYNLGDRITIWDNERVYEVYEREESNPNDWTKYIPPSSDAGFITFSSSDESWMTEETALNAGTGSIASIIFSEFGSDVGTLHESYNIRSQTNGGYSKISNNKYNFIMGSNTDLENKITGTLTDNISSPHGGTHEYTVQVLKPYDGWQWDWRNIEMGSNTDDMTYEIKFDQPVWVHDLLFYKGADAFHGRVDRSTINFYSKDEFGIENLSWTSTEIANDPFEAWPWTHSNQVSISNSVPSAHNSITPYIQSQRTGSISGSHVLSTQSLARGNVSRILIQMSKNTWVPGLWSYSNMYFKVSRYESSKTQLWVKNLDGTWWQTASSNLIT